jgi:hypothetical protein
MEYCFLYFLERLNQSTHNVLYVKSRHKLEEYGFPPKKKKHSILCNLINFKAWEIFCKFKELC